MCGGGEGGGALIRGRPDLALGSALVHQTKQIQRKHHTAKQGQTIQNIKHLFLLIFYFCIIKHKREQSGQLYGWPQC